MLTKKELIEAMNGMDDDAYVMVTLKPNQNDTLVVGIDSVSLDRDFYGDHIVMEGRTNVGGTVKFDHLGMIDTICKEHLLSKADVEMLQGKKMEILRNRGNDFYDVIHRTKNCNTVLFNLHEEFMFNA